MDFDYLNAEVRKDAIHMLTELKCYEHVVINSPFFHLHVHTLGQMVLKALEVMEKVAITKKSISCILTILPFLFLLVFS